MESSNVFASATFFLEWVKPFGLLVDFSFGGKELGSGLPRGHPLISRFFPDLVSGLILPCGRKPSSSSTLAFKPKPMRYFPILQITMNLEIGYLCFWIIP
jgi:hypothetical protein